MLNRRPVSCVYAEGLQIFKENCLEIMNAKETKCQKWASHILKARTYQQTKLALAIALSTEETQCFDFQTFERYKLMQDDELLSVLDSTAF